MQERKINYQVVYYHPDNINAIAMNLISFGLNQFLRTKRWNQIAVFKLLCDNIKQNKPVLINEAAFFAFDQLIESIRITICFENYMKALLLLKGFIIHKIDKEQLPNLYKNQFQRPISYEELTKEREWEINPKIQSEDEGLKHQLKGLSELTIGMKELLTQSYQSALGIRKEIIELCSPFFKYRNNLHYYCEESLSINFDDYTRFITLIDYINENHIRTHNELVDHLQKGDNYKISSLNYSA